MNVSLPLTGRVSSESVGYSISVDRGAITVALALLQASSDYHTPSNLSAAATGSFAPSMMNESIQAVHEMQDFWQPKAPKPSRPQMSLFQLLVIGKWELLTWTIEPIGFLSNLLLFGISTVHYRRIGIQEPRSQRSLLHLLRSLNQHYSYPPHPPYLN
jgi:hypothetical protein